MEVEALERRAQIGRDRRERTRRKLLGAAAKVIAERGDSGANIESFIAAAGVARGTFYNYFDSREALIEALLLEVGSDPFHSLQQTWSMIEDPLERLSVSTQMIMQRAQADPVWGWLVIYLANSDEIMRHELSSYPMTHLAQAFESSTTEIEDLQVACDVVVGIALAAIKAVLKRKPPINYPERVCRMMLQALGLSAERVQTVVSKGYGSLSLP